MAQCGPQRGSLNGALHLLTADTSVEVLAANLNRSFLELRVGNGSYAIGFGETASTSSYRVSSGTILRFDGDFVPTDSISVRALDTAGNCSVLEG